MEKKEFVLEEILCDDLGDGRALAELSFDGEELLFIPAAISLEDFDKPAVGAVLPMELTGYVHECGIYENEEAYYQAKREEKERTGKKGMFAAECFSAIGLRNRRKGAEQCVPVALLGARALAVEEGWGDDLRPIWYVQCSCMGCPVTLVVDSIEVDGIPHEGSILHGIFLLFAEPIRQ